MVAINNERPLTLAEAKRHLRYDPASGNFHWLTQRGRKRVGDIAGCLKRTGYVEVRLFQGNYLGHRLAWLFTHGEWPSGQIDHANLNKSDNRISNLRLADPSLNRANTPIGPRNTSGFKGVSFSKNNGKWVAYIRRNGRGSTIGYFDSAAEAGAAYEKRAAQVFGEFARAR
jgi:hypothetical protein